MSIFNNKDKAKIKEAQEKRFNERFNELKSLYGYVDRFNDLDDGIMFLKDSNYLELLIDAYDLKDRIYGEGVKRNDFLNSPLIKMADNHLYKPAFIINPHPLKEVGFPAFLRMHQFFEYLYYINTNKPLNVGDMENIYYSDLVERVILLLEDFDDDNVKIELTTEFFQNLSKVKWQKQSKELHKKIRNIFVDLDNLINHYLTFFSSEENNFICFICFCSAAADGRTLASVEDVIKAYITYLKLIKTDTTEYKARSEIVKVVHSDSVNPLVERFPGLNSPDARLNVWLRVWGLLLIGFGVAVAFLVKYPAYLIGSFFIIAGALSFVIVHRLMYVFYGFILMGLAVASFIMNYKAGALSFFLISFILFSSAWCIGKKPNKIQ